MKNLAVSIILASAFGVHATESKSAKADDFDVMQALDESKTLSENNLWNASKGTKEDDNALINRKLDFLKEKVNGGRNEMDKIHENVGENSRNIVDMRRAIVALQEQNKTLNERHTVNTNKTVQSDDNNAQKFKSIRNEMDKIHKNVGEDSRNIVDMRRAIEALQEQIKTLNERHGESVK